MQRNIAVLLSVNGASGFRAQMIQSATAVKAFEKNVQGTGNTVSRIGAGLKAGFAAMAVVVTMFFANAINSAVKFEAAMRNVNSISALSEQQLSGLSNQVLELSTRVPQSAQNLAEGLYEVASSGFQGAEGMKVLEASAIAASAGLTTTDVASKAIVASLNAYGLTAADAADVSDILFQTVNLGVVSFEELATQLGDVVGGASAAGVALDEVGAAVAAMTLSGLSAAESTTSLNQLIRALIDPSDELAGMFQDLGFESGKAALDTLGLHGTMEALREATGGNIETLIALFPEIRSARGAFALMAADGQNYARTFAAITDEQTRAGATQRAFAEQMKGLGNQWKLFVNNIQAASIQLGTRLIPILRQGLEAVQRFGSSLGATMRNLGTQAAPALRAVQDALGNLVRLGKEVVDAVSPVARAFGAIAAGTAIAALHGMAEAISLVAGFLADHPGLVRAVAMVYGGVLVGRLLTAAAAFVRVQAGLLAVRAGLAGLAAQSVLQSLALRASYFADALYAVFSTGNLRNIGGFKTAFEGLGSALSSPALAGTVLIGGLYAMQTGLDQAHREAKQFIDTLNEDFDVKSVDSVNTKVDALRSRMAELDREWEEMGGGGFGTILQGTLEILTPMENEVLDNATAWKDLNQELERTRAAGAMLEHDIATVSNTLGMSADEVERWLGAMDDYDPTNTQQTTDDLAQSVQAMAAAARAGTPATDELADATDTVGDSTASATDRVQALADAIDALIGTMLGSSNAAIAYQDAIDKLSTSFAENGTNLDINSEAGRANASAINEAVEAAIDHANAIAEETGSVRDGVGALELYRAQLVGQLQDMGLSTQAAERYINQLGLTPDNISTLIQLEGGEAARQEAGDLQGLLEAIDQAKVTGEVNLNSEDFDHNAEAIGDWFEQIAIAAPEASITLDDSQFVPTAQQVQEWVQKYDDSSPEAQALLNAIDPQHEFDTLSQAAAAWDERVATADARANATQAHDAINGSQEHLAAWNRSRGTATADANNNPARRRIAQAKEQLTGWGRSRGTATAAANDAPAQSAIGRARSSLARWGNARATGIANLDDNASSPLGRILQQIGALDGRQATVSVAFRSYGVAELNRARALAGMRHGGITNAQTGLVQAGIYRTPAVYFAEPETGGEAFIPKIGNRDRAIRTLEEAAAWHGARVVPEGTMGVPVMSARGSSSGMVIRMGDVSVSVRPVLGMDTAALRREIASDLRREFDNSKKDLLAQLRSR